MSSTRVFTCSRGHVFERLPWVKVPDNTIRCPHVVEGKPCDGVPEERKPGRR